MIILVISSIFSLLHAITTQTKTYFKKFLGFCLLVVMSCNSKNTQNYINSGILSAVYALLIGLYGHIIAFGCVGFGTYGFKVLQNSNNFVFILFLVIFIFVASSRNIATLSALSRHTYIASPVAAIIINYSIVAGPIGPPRDILRYGFIPSLTSDKLYLLLLLFAFACVGFDTYGALKSWEIVKVKQFFNIIGLGNDLQSSTIVTFQLVMVCDFIENNERIINQLNVLTN